MAATVTFVCDCKTSYGERLLLVGSAPELGNWSVGNGLAMLTSASGFPTWTSPPIAFDMSATKSEVIEYKYVRAGPDGFTWEPGRNRTIMVGDSTDGEASTVNDGHFNLADKSRVSKGRVRRLKTSMSSLPDSELQERERAVSDEAPSSGGQPGSPAEDGLKAKADQAQEQVQKLTSELETLRAARADTERLRAELASERLDRARSKARDEERAKSMSTQLDSESLRAAQLEAKLQMAISAQAEATKLKAELQKERSERASSRARHRSKTKELERLREEKEEQLLELSKPTVEVPSLQDWQLKIHAGLVEEAAALRDATKHVTKAAMAELQSLGALRQAQKQEFEAELDLLELSLEGREDLDLEASRLGGQEARRQRQLAERARLESERQHKVLTVEARKLARRAQRLREPPRQLRRQLGRLFLLVLLMGAAWSTTTPAAQQALQRAAEGGKEAGEWLLEKGDVATTEAARLAREGYADACERSTAALESAKELGNRLLGREPPKRRWFR